MKEKINIKIKCYTNNIGPSFRIWVDDVMLEEKKNYKKNIFEKTYECRCSKGKHSIAIEHFDKDPKYTNKDQNKDVALELEELKFNGIKVSNVALHSLDFHVSKWRYPAPKTVSNSLYFGFNGIFKYYFESPSMRYILNEHKKHSKENYVLQQDNFQITEELFIEKLKKHIKN